MPYTPIRRDFVFDAKCSAERCPRTLTSNVAVILRNDAGNELPFGPKCAKKQLDEEGLRQLRFIPDFTKAAPGEEREGGGGGGSGGGPGPGPRDPQARLTARAITYLLLRQERLAHVPGAGYSGFAAYNETYQASRALSDDAVTHILNVERRQADGRYGFDSLQAVYAYDRCLTRALRAVDEDRREFLADVQGSLRRSLRLTEAQVHGIEKWFEKIPGYVPLDPSGFTWSWDKS
jgi:hypothetical protein